MSQSSPRIPDEVAVECPVCYTRMHARPGKKPGRVKCPDCYTLARVPTIDEVLAKLPRERAAEIIGTYDLGSLTNPTLDDPSTKDWPAVGSYHLHGLAATPREFLTSPPEAGPATPTGVSPRHEGRPPASPRSPAHKPAGRSRPPARERGPGDEPLPDASNAPIVRCPACGARIEPPLADQPQTILCPDCLEDVPVPSRRDLLARSRRREPAAEPEPSAAPRTSRRGGTAHLPVRSEAAVGRAHPAAEEPIEFAAAALPPREYVNVFDALAEIRQEKSDPPPRWTFFSSVFGFPWRPDMLVRWIYLTLGFTAYGLLMSGFLLLAAHAYWLLVLMFFLPGLAIAAGLTLSYAAASFVPILIDTAAGNDRVTSWPDSNWREWAVELMYLVLMALTATVFGHLAGLIASTAGGDYHLVLGVTAFLSFPIVLLSSQEANSPFIPLSLPILKSLATCAWGWLMFYALSALVVGAAAALIWLQWRASPFFALFGSSPMLATVFLVYPRLLGRLAWRASLARPRRRKRRRQAEFPAPAGAR